VVGFHASPTKILQFEGPPVRPNSPHGPSTVEALKLRRSLDRF
jgi:hypothetical protein